MRCNTKSCKDKPSGALLRTDGNIQVRRYYCSLCLEKAVARSIS